MHVFIGVVKLFCFTALGIFCAALLGGIALGFGGIDGMPLANVGFWLSAAFLILKGLREERKGHIYAPIVFLVLWAVLSVADRSWHSSLPESTVPKNPQAAISQRTLVIDRDQDYEFLFKLVGLTV
jgi:hypothetical protein